MCNAVINQNLTRAFVLFELTPANEISLLDPCERTLGKCCIDPLRPPRLSGLGFSNLNKVPFRELAEHDYKMPLQSTIQMTEPKKIMIDPLSACSLWLETHALGKPLGGGTGFCVESGGKKFLITNWHVVSGRNSETGEILSQMGALPDELVIRHHSLAGLGSWVFRVQPLQTPTGSNAWNEHPRGRAVDVVALPLDTQIPDTQFYPLSLDLADFDMLVQVAMPVSIIGFPFGLAAGGAWPIWKTGHIASDPDLDYDGRPAFLIDATTREGMSGSPVILRQYGGYATSKASMAIGGGPGTRFLGVYSGRIHDQAEIGRVWRPSVIRDILAIV
jgi:Trypsin-like peptidase domain